MRYVVSAGGTGGHIYPAISIIKKIKEIDKEAEVLYIGTTTRMESTIVPKEGIPYFGVNMIGLKKDLSIFKAGFLFLKAIRTCKKKIKEFKPDIVIGVGGYITTPVIKAANSLHIPTVIHEQNSIPGKSNKFLTKKVDKIFVSLPGSFKYFPKEKTILTGNPRSQEVYNAKVIDKKELGLSKDKKLVLIVMGSLGSETINAALLDAIPKFNEVDYEIIIVTGKDHFDEFKDIKANKNVFVKPYLDNMANILGNVDVIVSRAGASTIAEITSLGIPSILVPSPYVANNHQYFNAKELVDNGASILLEEKDFNANNLLEKIDLLMKDRVLYNKMHEESLKLSNHQSCDLIYKEIKELIK